MAEKQPSLSELKGRKIGRVLNKMGKVTRDQINEALALQEKKRAPLGQLLVELGYVSHDDVNLALAAQAGMETVNLEDFDLVAPDEGAEPPPEVSSSLHQRLELDQGSTDDLTTLQLRRNHGWRTVLLHAQAQAGTRIVVGAAVLFRGEQKIRMPPPGLREAIGQRLYDEGDVYTTVGSV